MSRVKILLFIPRHTIVAGYYGLALVVHVFACLPVVSRMAILIFLHEKLIWVNLNGFLPNLVCTLILLRSVMGLLMGNFRQFLTIVICPQHSVFISGQSLA